MSRPLSRLLLSLCLTAGVAACAGPGGRDGGPGGTGRGDMAERRGGASSPVDLVQAQLRDSAEELKLTPKQLPLWEAYQEKVGALMADLLRSETYQRPGQSAPRQIAGKVDTVRNRLAALEDIAEAANRLYDSLDAGQKAVADRRLANTVPALYSGLGGAGGRGEEPAMGGGDRGGPSGRSRSGGMGGPGGMGGGLGRF